MFLFGIVFVRGCGLGVVVTEEEMGGGNMLGVSISIFFRFEFQQSEYAQYMFWASTFGLLRSICGARFWYVLKALIYFRFVFIFVCG